MTELERAKEALAKEIAAFNEQTILLQTESDAARNEHRVAQRHLTEHRNSRKAVLGPFYEALAVAEAADIEEQAERLKNTE